MNQSPQQLELKRICPYLPYELKYLQSLSGAILTLNPSNVKYFIQTEDKPLLIPLSEIKTEKYINIFFQKDTFMYEVTNSDNQIESASAFANRFKITDNDYCYPYEFFDLLFQYHFDAFGLIDAGLALNKMDFIK